MMERQPVAKLPQIKQARQEHSSLSAVHSVERAFDLLEYLARAQDWVRISELSQATGQPVGTIHRLLKTLIAREYVVRDSATRLYTLGPALRRLAGKSSQTPDWTQIATPCLQELVEASGESANLAVLERNRAVYEAQAQPRRMVRMFTEIGNRVPLYCTGCGKVLLAFQPDSVVASLVAEEGMPRYTERTITDFGQLQQELELIRQQGYTIDNGEMEDGVRCIAVPVYSTAGKVVAAISISGPSSRVDARSIPTFLPYLKRASAAISSRLAAARESEEGA
jgi:IclR family acetate operon transcriptional repressor